MCVCSIRLQSAVVEFFWGALGAPLKFSTISNIIFKHCCAARCSKPTQTRIFFCFVYCQQEQIIGLNSFTYLGCVSLGIILTETSSPDLDSTVRLSTQRNCTCGNCRRIFNANLCYHNLHTWHQNTLLSTTFRFPACSSWSNNSKMEECWLCRVLAGEGLCAQLAVLNAEFCSRCVRNKNPACKVEQSLCRARVEKQETQGQWSRCRRHWSRVPITSIAGVTTFCHQLLLNSAFPSFAMITCRISEIHLHPPPPPVTEGAREIVDCHLSFSPLLLFFFFITEEEASPACGTRYALSTGGQLCVSMWNH